MAKDTTAQVEDLEETEVEETKAVRPSDLAETLDISPKALRGFLRREFPRSSDQKNTSWTLTDEMIAKATEYFSEDEDDEAGDEAE